MPLFTVILITALVSALPAHAGFLAPIAGAFLGLGAVGTAVLQIGLGVGASLIARARQPKQKKQGPGALSLDVPTQGDATPQTIILGRRAVVGHRTCPEYSRANGLEWLTIVRDLADAPISRLVAIWIGNDRIAMPSSFPAWSDPSVFHDLGGKYAGKARLRFHDGSQTQADNFMLWAYANHPDRPWSADMVLRGVPYVIVELKRDAELFPGQPDLLFEVEGMRLYDPRSGQMGYSSNLALLSYNVLRGIQLPDGSIYGGQLADTDLPLSSWGPAISEANAQEWRGGLEVNVGPEDMGGDHPYEIADHLLQGCAGQVAESGGIWRVRIGGPGLPVATITDGDMIVTESQVFTPHLSPREVYNGISAQYPEPDERWEPKAIPLLLDADYVTADGGRNVTSITYHAISDSRRAQELTQMALDDNRRQRMHEISSPPDYMPVEVLDTVRLHIPADGYVNKLVEVQAIWRDPVTLNQRMLAREVDPEDYTPPAVSLLPTQPVVTTPPAPQVLPGWAVEAVVVQDSEGRNRRAGARISWTPLPAEGIEWQLRSFGQTELAGEGTHQDVERGQRVITAGVISGARMEIRGRAVLRTRARQWTDWTEFAASDVGIIWEDWDAQLREEIQRDLEKADQAAEDAKEALRLADAAQAYADQQDAILRESLEEANAEISGVRADLLARAADLAARIVSEAARADAYTDTELYDFNVVVQGQFDAMAGQISELTAALTSDNLIANGAFANSLSGWEGTAVAILDRQGSTNALILAAPELQMAQVGDNATGQLRQSLASFEVTSDDRLQLRFAAAAAALRSVTITVQWLDVSGAVMSTASRTVTVSPANQWKVYSEQFEPPVGARGANLTLGKTQTGVPLLVTAVSASTINVAIAAQIAELSAAQVNLESSLATLQSSVDTRFSDANTRITNETTARTSALGAMGARVSTVETRSSDNAGRLSTAETSLSNAQGSIVQLRQDLTAEGTAWRGGVAEERTARQTETGALAGRAMRVEASVGQGDSVINDTLLSSSGWTRWGSQGSLLLLPGSVYPLGRDWRFSITSPSAQDGLQLSQSPASIWTGQLNADAYVMEIDFTLVSGSISGAGVNFRWTNTTGASFNNTTPLSAMQAGPRVNNGTTQTARAVFKRPSGFSGTFASHTVFVHANDTPAWTGGGANKVIMFHRIRIRPATAEELGGGAVADGVRANVLSDYLTSAQTTQAIASLQESLTASLGGNLAAVRRSATAIADLSGSVARFTQIATVDGGRQAAGIEVVSFNNAGGASGSLVKLIGDNVVVPGTLSASRLVISDLANRVTDPNGLDLDSWQPSTNTTLRRYATAGEGDWATNGLAVYSRDRAYAEFINSPKAYESPKSDNGFSVSPGEVYYIKARVHKNSGGNAPLTAYLGLRVSNAYDQNSESAYPRVAVNWGAGQGGWRVLEGMVTIPNSVGNRPAELALVHGGINNQFDTDGIRVIFSDMIVRRATDAVLIQDGAVIARHVTADTMRALNGRFSNLAAANVRIGAGEIETLMIGENAVVVPVGGKGGVISSAGQGNWRNLLVLNVPLFRAGPMAVSWAIRHYYYEGGFGAYGLRIRLNGTIIEEKEANGLPSDFPSGNAFGRGVAGNNTIALQWQGWGGVRLEGQGSMTVLGIQ